MARTPKGPKQVSTLVHDDATRKNIPTAELQSTAEYLEEMNPAQPVAYPRARPLAEGERRERDEDLDPQIVWNGARSPDIGPTIRHIRRRCLRACATRAP